MHYYQFNIGDYASHTRHLSIVEDIAYRRLLDLYYLHERPLGNCSVNVARLIGMSEYSQEVETVLMEFFEHVDGGYINGRADKEIAHYHSKIEQASRAGKASAERRLNTSSTDVQLNIKQETINIKQETKKTAPEVAVCLPDWMPVETWEAFLAMRKKIKKPATEYAIKLLIDKLTKFKAAGQDVQKVLEKSITAGWQDVFEIHEKQQFNKFDVSHVTTPPPPNQDAALRKIEEDRRNSKPPSLEVLAKMAALRKEISHG